MAEASATTIHVPSGVIASTVGVEEAVGHDAAHRRTGSDRWSSSSRRRGHASGHENPWFATYTLSRSSTTRSPQSSWSRTARSTSSEGVPSITRQSFPADMPQTSMVPSLVNAVLMGELGRFATASPCRRARPARRRCRRCGSRTPRRRATADLRRTKSGRERFGGQRYGDCRHGQTLDYSRSPLPETGRSVSGRRRCIAWSFSACAALSWVTFS